MGYWVLENIIVMHWEEQRNMHYLFEFDRQQHIAVIDAFLGRYWHDRMPDKWFELPDNVHGIVEARAWVLASWSTS